MKTCVSFHLMVGGHSILAHWSWSQPQGEDGFLLGPGLKLSQLPIAFLTELECDLQVSFRASSMRDVICIALLSSWVSSILTVDKNATSLRKALTTDFFLFVM